MVTSYLAQRDTLLGRVIAEVGELSSSYSLSSEPWLALAKAIVGQQISLRAAETVWQRLCGYLGDTWSLELLLNCDKRLLRGQGLSEQKVRYLLEVAQLAARNELNRDKFLSLDDQTILRQLKEIPGVGEWTAQMVLIFSLQRPDIFAYADLRIRQTMQLLYSLPQDDAESLKKSILEIASRWTPHKSTACLYLWDWSEKAKRL